MRVLPSSINAQLSRNKYYYVREEKEKDWDDIMQDAATHIFFLEIFRAMGLATSQLLREPATINYPFEKGPLSPRFRGEHALRRYFYITIFNHFQFV